MAHQNNQSSGTNPVASKSFTEAPSKRDYAAEGYRITSRKYGMISRIDRPDWKEYMAAKHAPWDVEGEGMKWVRALGDRHAADHYRRVYSKDTLEIGREALRLKIPNSGDMI